MRRLRYLACLASGIWVLCNIAEAGQVSFPEVPSGWEYSAGARQAVYRLMSAPDAEKKQHAISAVKLSHLSDIHQLDAKSYSDEYAQVYACQAPKLQRLHFYHALCPKRQAMVYVIGERNNLYLIEALGKSDPQQQLIVDDYINRILTEEDVFNDPAVGSKLPNSNDHYKDNQPKVAPKPAVKAKTLPQLGMLRPGFPHNN